MENPVPTQRLLSLDVMRGLIMLLLAGESCMLYESLHEVSNTGFPGAVIDQFFHHPWHGLRFWDLVQPAFMTMAGAAMYIAWHYKNLKGMSPGAHFKHIAVRCFKLFLFGTALHCVYAGKLVWELWNVLTQLAFTTLIAYAIIRKPVIFQLIVSMLLLLVTELLYRYVQVPGYANPFTSGSNFGNWMDMVLMGKMNSDGWVAINILPTAAHTIWGVLAGKLLIGNKLSSLKIEYLLFAAVTGLVLGYGLNTMNITPIIKRISTSSFVLVSGGWVMAILAFLYWLVDVKKQTRFAWVFVVVGMNAIFIYLFFETLGHQWLNAVVAIFVRGFVGFSGMPGAWLSVLSALATLVLEWYICYWLFKRKIFFKL